MRVAKHSGTILALLMSCFAVQGARATQQVFDSSAGWTVPTGVTSVTVECIGSGGSGGTSNSGAGGGGGGAYSRSVLTVVPGDNYEAVISDAGSRDSHFDHVVVDSSGTHFIPVVRAQAGADASARTGGLGGQASSGLGDVTYDGGTGGTSSGGRAGGGGGGSAAESTGAGVNGGANSGSAGGAGGTLGNSTGGAGGAAGQSGSTGVVGGGAGGGGDKDGPAVGSINGRIILTW